MNRRYLLRPIKDTRWPHLIVMLVLLPFLIGWTSGSDLDDQKDEDAVVRVFSLECSSTSDCKVAKKASGVVVHPYGLVMTAWHATVPGRFPKWDAEHYETFVIVVPPSSSGDPQREFRAKILGDARDADIALLRIVEDSISGIPIEWGDLSLHALPVKPLSSFDRETLPILCYSEDSANALIADEYTVSEFDEEQSIIIVDAAMSAGHSGGPAVVDSTLVGIVSQKLLIQNRTKIRLISPDIRFRWLSDEKVEGASPRIWANNVQIEPTPTDERRSASIAADIFTVGMDEDEQVVIGAYVFYGEDRTPLLIDRATSPNWSTALNGQVIFDSTAEIDTFIDWLSKNDTEIDINIDNLLSIIEEPVDQLSFRLLLWDGSRGYWIGDWLDYSIPKPKPIVTPVPHVEPSEEDEPELLTIQADELKPPPVQAGEIDSPLTGRIAFTKLTSRGFYDTYIYCLDSGQICAHLQNVRQPNFSNSGYLVVNGEGGEKEDLLRMSPGYDNVRPISRHPEDELPAWSPSGNRVIFDSTVGDGKYRIFRLDKPTKQPDGEAENVIHAGSRREIFGHHPIYLDDGRIAFQGCNSWVDAVECGIYVTDDFGYTHPIRITDKDSDLPTDNLGTRILFNREQNNNWDVYIADSNYFNYTRLTEDPAVDGLATASPDGRHIAFVSNRNSDGSWSVFLINSDGSNLRKLFDIEGQPYGTHDKDWRQERLSWGP